MTDLIRRLLGINRRKPADFAEMALHLNNKLVPTKYLLLSRTNEHNKALDLEKYEFIVIDTSKCKTDWDSLDLDQQNDVIAARIQRRRKHNQRHIYLVLKKEEGTEHGFSGTSFEVYKDTLNEDVKKIVAYLLE